MLNYQTNSFRQHWGRATQTITMPLNLSIRDITRRNWSTQTKVAVAASSTSRPWFKRLNDSPKQDTFHQRILRTSRIYPKRGSLRTKASVSMTSLLFLAINFWLWTLPSKVLWIFTFKLWKTKCFQTSFLKWLRLWRIANLHKRRKWKAIQINIWISKTWIQLKSYHFTNGNSWYRNFTNTKRIKQNCAFTKWLQKSKKIKANKTDKSNC